MEKTSPTNLKKRRICFLVSNDIINDPRVVKQVDSAVKFGLEIIALGYGYPSKEAKRGRFLKSNIKIEIGEFDPKTKIPIKIIKFMIAVVKSIIRRAKIWLKLGSASQAHGVGAQPALPIPTAISKNTTIYQILWQVFKNFTKSLPSLNFYWSMTKFMTERGIEFKPDIVHANDLDTLLAGYWIKKKTGAKLIYDAHEIWTKQGLLLPKKILDLFSLIEKILIKRIDGFISVNESIIKEISRMYNYKFSIPTTVIYNCPNYEPVEYQPHHGHIQILYQGRYCFDRGLEELVQSMRYLPQNVKLYFRALGDPLTKERLKNIVSDYKLEKKVFFLDPVPMHKMIESAKTADIGVIPYVPVNINNKLCTPNKLFEYAMAGLALAVSDLPELKKMIKKYQNGLSFNPRSSKSIARAINQIIESKKMNQMRQNSLKAAQEYNWEHEEKKLFNLYLKLSHDQK